MADSSTGPADGSITPGSDFLQLRIEEAPAGGRSDWLAERLRHAIADGRLPVGSRLPATRVLAADLGVSRGVVTEAYRRLGEDGQLAGRGRGGTVVVAAPVAAPGVAGSSGGSVTGPGVGPAGDLMTEREGGPSGGSMSTAGACSSGSRLATRQRGVAGP